MNCHKTIPPICWLPFPQFYYMDWVLYIIHKYSTTGNQYLTITTLSYVYNYLGERGNRRMGLIHILKMMKKINITNKRRNKKLNQILPVSFTVVPKQPSNFSGIQQTCFSHSHYVGFRLAMAALRLWLLFPVSSHSQTQSQGKDMPFSRQKEEARGLMETCYTY